MTSVSQISNCSDLSSGRGRTMVRPAVRLGKLSMGAPAKVARMSESSISKNREPCGYALPPARRSVISVKREAADAGLEIHRIDAPARITGSKATRRKWIRGKVMLGLQGNGGRDVGCERAYHRGGTPQQMARYQSRLLQELHSPGSALRRCL